MRGLPKTVTARVAVGQTAVAGETVIAEFGGAARALFNAGVAIQRFQGQRQIAPAFHRQVDEEGEALGLGEEGPDLTSVRPEQLEWR